MIEIDGSQKSGSGTLLRDAAVFCALRGETLRIENIRAKRPKPGLRPQHLKGLEAAARICGGTLEGAVVGSGKIVFRPGSHVRGGKYEWDIGSAGSAVMLAAMILPLGLMADCPSRYRITGGLFQDFAPSAFHFCHVLLPILKKMGIGAEAFIRRAGYVPRGQGVIEVQVTPKKETLSPLFLADPGRVRRVGGIALSSLIAEKKVSERMARACSAVLRENGYDAHIEIRYDEKDSPAYDLAAVQPGAALAVWAQTETGCLIGADTAGARGRSSEAIGKKTARHLLEDLASGASVDRHLADQLVPFAALAQGESVFRTPTMTDHLEARLWLVEKILGAETQVEKGLMRIRGISI